MKLFVNDKTFYRKVVNLAVPVVLQGMLTIGVNMIDTIMLGAYGEYQLAHPWPMSLLISFRLCLWEWDMGQQF